MRMLAHRKKTSGSRGEQALDQDERENDSSKQQHFYMADELTWPTRITIILIGASVLFSIFFGLEFIVAKLVSSLSTPEQAAHRDNGQLFVGLGAAAEKSTSALVRANKSNKCDRKWPFDDHWPHQRETIETDRANRELLQASTTQPTGRPATGKLGINFDLIYESDLRLNEAQTSYELESAEPNGPTQELETLSVKPELKLEQLLAGYHVAMPFNPDIWILSEPRDQARELLSGNLSECEQKLSSLVEWLERSFSGKVAELNSSTLATNSEPPLARVGQNHYKLMKWLDAFGRPESGLLMGHPFWLGSYLECEHLNSMNSSPKRRRRGQKPSDPIESLRTRYCVGKLAFKSWLTDTATTTATNTNGRAKQSIKVGLCLPLECDSLELFEHSADGARLLGRGNLEQSLESVRQLAERLVQFNLDNPKLYPAQQFKLLDIYCLPLAERRQLSGGAYLLLLTLVSWLTLLVLCTVLRSRRRRRRQQQQESADRSCELGLATALEELLGDKLLDWLAVDANFDLFLGAKQQKSNLLARPSKKGAEHAESQQEESSGGQQKVVQVVNLNVLDSVKHLGCVGVVLAHVLLTYLTMGTSYRHTIETIGRDLRTMLLLSLNNIVDTFFVISGLLVAYLTFKKMAAKKRVVSKKVSTNCSATADSGEAERRNTAPSSWLFGYLHIVASRYLRMAPLYFLVYAFVKTISVYLGEGPLWDYATNSDSLRGLCKRESWLWPLTFASDLKPISQHCVPAAWSISVDMQFFLVAPIFVQLLQLADNNKRQRWTSYGLLGSLVLLSTALTLADYKSLLDYVSLRDFAKLRLHVFTVLIRHAAHAYNQPQNRIGPILIGLIGGHLLHRYEVQSTRSGATSNNRGQWPFWMRGRYFKLTLMSLVAFVLAPCFVQLRARARHWDEMGPDDGSSQSFGMIRPMIRLLLALNTSVKFDCYLALGGFVLIKLLWSVCNCIIFLRLVTDLNGTIWARLMSLQFWQVLSRLNYAILLVHFEVIAYEANSRLSHQQPFTWSQFMCKFSFAYLVSLLLAGPLYVLFEQPVHQLISGLILNGGGSRMKADNSGAKLRQLLADTQQEARAQSERGPQIKLRGHTSPNRRENS